MGKRARIHRQPQEVNSLLLLCLSCFIKHARCQFSSAAPCPNNDDIQGYTTIEDLNADMAAELREIVEVSKPQNPGGYDYILCPSTVFSMDVPLLPGLDNARFICGEDGANEDECVFSGGEQQVLIQNPADVGDDYVFNTITFLGVTFEDFSNSSLSLEADAPLQAVFLNSLWQNFDTESIVVIQNADNRPGDLRIEMSSIESSPNQDSRSRVQEAFVNEGGTIQMSSTLVRNVAVEATIFRTVDNGITLVRDSEFSASSVVSLAETSIGRIDFNRTTVELLTDLETMFNTSGAGSSTALAELSIASNTGDGENPFSILVVRNSAQGTILDSVFRNNTPIEHAAFAITEPANFDENTFISIASSNFTANGGTGSGSGQAFPTGEAIVRSENGGSSIQLIGNEFVGNSNVLTNIGAFFGGFVVFRNTCFIRNDAFMTTLILENSRESDEDPPTPGAADLYFAENNYVEDETSFICDGTDSSGGLGRNSIEQPGSGCFVSNNCDLDCLDDANDAAVCLSQVNLAPTESPMPSLSNSPSLSSSPSLSNEPSVSTSPSVSTQPSLSLQPSTRELSLSQQPSSIPSQEPSFIPSQDLSAIPSQEPSLSVQEGSAQPSPTPSIQPSLGEGSSQQPSQSDITDPTDPPVMVTAAPSSGSGPGSGVAPTVDGGDDTTASSAPSSRTPPADTTPFPTMERETMAPFLVFRPGFLDGKGGGKGVSKSGKGSKQAKSTKSSKISKSSKSSKSSKHSSKYGYFSSSHPSDLGSSQNPNSWIISSRSSSNLALTRTGNRGPTSSGKEEETNLAEYYFGDDDQPRLSTMGRASSSIVHTKWNGQRFQPTPPPSSKDKLGRESNGDEKSNG